MSNKEMVIETLQTYGCSTAKQVANLIHRNYDITLTPAQVSGAIRPLIAKGYAASSKNDKNMTVYWLNKKEW